MTANQRRPGFRLPWSSELGDAAEGEAAEVAGATGETDAPAPSTNGAAQPHPEPAAPASAAPGELPTPVEASVATGEVGTSPDFMRELVSAMRKVADEARESGVGDARSHADAQVARLEAAAETRRAELQAAAERDIAAVGEWAQAEAARIRREAEERVAARRSQLEQQLAADATRTREEGNAVRERAAAYERELEAYHAQLLEIDDPAAFAAAAKRMPQPPAFEDAPAAETPAPAAAPEPVETPSAAAAVPAPSETPIPDVHPAEEEVLPAMTEATPVAGVAAPEVPPVAAARAEPVTTDIVVKGLGSFGAITGFRQTLAGAEGIDGVALSLGQTGEFVFRATHQPGLDIAAVIRGLEGESAKIEAQGEGGLQVTLDKAR